VIRPRRSRHSRQSPFLSVLVCLVLMVGLAAPPARAQEHPNVARGFNPTASFDYAGVDNVNQFNGNLVVTLPLGQSFGVGGGLAWQLTLVYNSQVWMRQDYGTLLQSVPSPTNNAGLGWMVSLGRMKPPDYQGDFDPRIDTYMSPDGARHTFYPTLHEGETQTAGYEYTRDGSYLRYNSNAGELELPDGTIHTFGIDGFPTKIRDRFGNHVDICYDFSQCGAPVGGWRISDGQRSVNVYFKTGPTTYQYQVVDRIEVPVFPIGQQPPGPAAYTFHYNLDDGITTLLTGCSNVDTNTANLSVALLTSVTLPDGTAWSMPAGDYFGTSAGLPCKSGMLHQLTLPTLGKIAWDYIGYTYPTGSTTRGYWQAVTGVGTRSLLDANGNLQGTWTYTTSLNAGKTELTNTVTAPQDPQDPQRTVTTRYFSVCAANCDTAQRYYEYGLPMSRDQPGDGTGRFLSAVVAKGTTLRTSYVRYEHDLEYIGGSSFQDKTRSDQRVASQRTVFNDDGGLIADDSSASFDGVGHYRSHTTGGTFPGTNTHTSATGYTATGGTYGQSDYVPVAPGSPWILGSYTFQWDSENGQLLYRSFCFDPATGFLRGRRVHAANDASYRANDLVEVFNADAAGNPITESYYGGDAQPVATDTNQGFICNLAATLTGPAYRIRHTYSGGVRNSTSYTVGGTTLKTLDLTLDGPTGLASSSSDTAGVTTTYRYDSLGRPFTVTPVQGAVTTYSFHNAASQTSPATATVTQASSSGASLQSRVTYDPLGRVTLEEELMPDGSMSQKRTSFNAMGWKTFVSNPGTPATGTSFSSFDAFGRPTILRPADGSAHDVTLSYAGTRQVTRTVRVATTATGESFATTTETYDRFGRLYQVTEPNNTVTRYDYDPANHLTHVCQGWNGSSCAQNRWLTYDNRGLLIAETHPEKQPNAYGQGNGVDYPLYDARGHALRRIDGPNDLTFVYDAAERLTLVRESGSGFTNCTANGGHRCLKSFTYATANGTTAAGATDYKTGKLVSASRFNFIGAPFNATVEVRESSTYAGLPGRLSQKDTAQIFNGTQSETFRQTFNWDDLGSLSSQTYPDCIAASICGASSPRTVTYNRGNGGRLTGIPGFLTSVTYQPSGLMATIKHANGTTDYQRADPNGIPRPAELYAYRDSDNFGLWTTGAYTYDGSGNVWKMGAATFLYDSLSRVTSGTVLSGQYSNGTANTQTYTYDPYGNLTGLTTNGVLLNTLAATATNRLTGGGYDTAGNLTAWSGNAYEYDAFNQMTRMVSGAEDWRYMYTAADERFWSYRVGGNGSLWTLRDLNGKVLRDYQAHLGWNFYRDYVHRDGTLLASVASPTAGGGLSHYHLDHLGTPRLITDATGGPGTAKFHTYYPYGQEVAGTYTTAYTDPLRFTGHERDLANIGGQGDDLDYMHARHESPIIGRFLSVDPYLDPKAGAPLPKTWNRYSYVLNDPVSKTDPTGRCIEDFCIGEALVAAAALVETPTGQELIENGEAEVATLAARIEPAAEETFTAVSRMARNSELGRLGERLAGIAQGIGKTAIESLTKTARNRVPDALDAIAKTLTEVKNVSGALRLTNQLKDFALWAHENGYQMVLWVKDPSKLSQALQALVNSGAIQIRIIK
jgi:RHS repeat-associated protein